jgi:hypothetical protein
MEFHGYRLFRVFEAIDSALRVRKEFRFIIFIIMKKKVLVIALSVMTVTLLCVFTLAPIAQAQSSGGIWSGDHFCENAGGFYCLPEVVVQ